MNTSSNNQREAHLEQEIKQKKEQSKIVENQTKIDWEDPFEKVINEKFDEDGRVVQPEEPQQFERMWFFLEDSFSKKLIKAKDQTIQLLQVLLLVTIYAFFGMLIIAYYAYYPVHLQKQQAGGSNYQSVAQNEEEEEDGEEGENKKKKKKASSQRSSTTYHIPELMATLWYNLSHLIFWKSTIQMGDDKEKDMETIKKELKEGFEKAYKDTKEVVKDSYEKTKEKVNQAIESVREEKDKKNQEDSKQKNGANSELGSVTDRAKAISNIGDELKPEKQSEVGGQHVDEPAANIQGRNELEDSIDIDLYDQNSIQSEQLVEPTYTARAMGYTKKKRVVLFGIKIPFEAALYGIFLWVGIIHFYLLVSSFRARPDHLLQVLLLSMCWGYLLLNLVFISIWLVGMSLGNWHRKKEQDEVIEDFMENSQIHENSFFLQFLGQLSPNSLWYKVGAFQNVEALDEKFKADSEFEWRSGAATLHYYLYIFHQYSLSHFRYCIIENQNSKMQDDYVSYEKQLTLLNPRQYNEVYAVTDTQIKRNTKGFWIGNSNWTCFSLTIFIAICTRFLFLIIAFFVDHFAYTNAVNQALANDTDPPTERKPMLFNNITILTFFLVIYAIQFIGFRIYSNRLRKLNGLVRLSGLLDYMNVDYEQKSDVPSELPPANVFCLLTLETWYGMRRLLNKLGKAEARFFDLELTISVGLIALIVAITILGYLNLNNIDWVYILIRENAFAMFGFYIDFFLLVIIASYKLCISARVNEHGSIHKKLLEKHLYVLKSLNGANIMASNIEEGEDFNSRCLRELKKQTQFYLLNGTLECSDEQLAALIRSKSISKISDIKDDVYEQGIVTAYNRYIELLIEKVETIVTQIEFDEKKHHEVLAFVLPVNNLVLYVVLLGSLAILLPLTTGKWIQYDQMSFYLSTLSAKISGSFWNALNY